MADEGRFSAEQLRRQQANPAAPSGLQQTAGRLARQVERQDESPVRLQQWMPQKSMLEEAKGWYAGANTESTTNGWDTPFYQRMTSQYNEWLDKAAQASRGSVFYDWLNPKVNPQATGVATWGADPFDEEAKRSGQMRFGDVFDNGRRVANVYEDFDKPTADTLMGELLPITNDDKARIFNDPNRTQLYAEEVEKYRKENTDRFLYSRSAEDYDSNVKQREEDLRRGAGDEATILGSMAASAGLGAAAGAVGGSIIPVLGTAAGAIGGAVVGGVAGLVGGILNQDQLVEMTARAQERADIANRELGSSWLQRATMNVGEYSQIAMKMISPTSNIVQGINDARLGEVGDMTSEFYELDADGNRKVGKVAKGADILATLADGVLQFASPAGTWTYMATMGGVVAGKTAEATTGEVFNERRGQFDPLETWQEKLATAGSIGIDVAQIGVAGAVVKSARSARALVTGTAEAGAESAAAVGMRNVTDGAINTAGMRFTRTAQGELKARPTLELIAPSEFLRWVPAGYQARKLAKIDGGSVTGEHLLQAATNLTGNGRFRDAVILGYSEGGEEFIQAYLDPARTGDRASFGDAFEAYLYGAASGAGMALGPVNRPPSSRQQLEMQAYVQHALRTGHMPTEDEWREITRGWRQSDYEKVARQDAQSAKFTRDVLMEIASQQRQDQAHHSSIGFARMEEMKLSNFDKLMRKALEEGNGSLVLLPQTAEFWVSPAGTLERAKFGANAGVMSATEVISQLKLIHDGQVRMAQTLAEQLAEAQASLQSATDADSRQRWTDAVAEAQTQLKDVNAQRVISSDVSGQMLGMFEAMSQETDPGRIRGHIDAMNQRIRDAFDGNWTLQDGTAADPRLAKRAVELRVGRHPFMDTGSFALLVPQIGDELTRLNAHGTVYVQQGMLKALGGDHDGDTVVPQHSIYLSDDDIDRLRQGDQYMRLTEVNNKPKVEIVMDRPDGEWAFLRSFSDAMLDPTSWGATTVTTRLDGLVKAIRAEFSKTFGGPLDDTKLEKLLRKFEESVVAGRKDAAMNLMQGMADENYEGMRTHRNAEGVPNMLWLNQKISETWDILQKDLAHVRASQPSIVPIDKGREAAETMIRDEIARRDAGTAGGSLSMLGASDAVRSAQYLHYSALYSSMTQIQPGETLTTDQQLKLTELFNQFGRGQAIRDLEKVTGRNAIEERVYYWLSQMANSVQDISHTTPETLLLLANVSVADIRMVAPNEYVVGDGNITMLQFLLGKSLDIEEAKHRGAPEDSDITKKIQSLRRLTRRDPDRSKHSDTASLAMIEVLGNRPLHELIGSSSSYISPQMTLNQLIQQQQGMSPGARSDEIHRLVRTPAYIKSKDITYGDPPWPAEVLTAKDPAINAFAMLVDAVKIYGDTYVPRLKGRDETIHKSFITGLRGLHQLMSSYRQLHHARLGTGTSQVDKITVLRDMLVNDQRLAVEISKLIPDAAALGVFQVHQDNTVTASEWLEDMLVEENLERAAAIYYWNIKFAEFNQLAGTYQRTEDSDTEDLRGRIDPAKLTSRFHRIMWHLASQEDSIELARFMKAMNDAPSIKHMFTLINEEVAWRGDQAELLAWHDDVSLFEVDPGETWGAAMGGSVMRENIRGWGRRLGILGSVAVEAEANYAANQTLLQRMDQWVKTRSTDNPINDGDARMYIGLLKRTIEQRRKFPDSQGQAARSQLVALQQMGLAATQNKGVADDMAAPFGEPLITMDSFGGFSDALLQELASITAEDEDAILSNLTMLVDGPVRIGLADGSTLLFDITNEEKALEMLLDPRTQGLAMAILFPTVRDVNTANVSQVYTDTDSLGNLAEMLKEQSFKPLFKEYTDFGEKLKQAHRYIGLIESYIRKDAQGVTDPVERDKAFHPIQHMIHDIMAAYLHSKDVKESEYDSLRDQLFIDVYEAIKGVASVEESEHGRLRDMVAATMQERFLKDNDFSNRLLDSDSSRMIVEIQTAADIHDKFEEGRKEIQDRLDAAATPAEADVIRQELSDFIREADIIRKTKVGYPHLTFLDAQAALKMFEMTGDPRQDGFRKAEILNYLGKQGRIHKALKKANQSLYHKALRVIFQDPNESFSPMLTEQEWKELGSWAAELYLRDVTSRGSSSLPMTSALLGEEGAAVQRYFDQSFMYLTDTLFNPKVLEAADILSQHNEHTQQSTSYDVAKKLTDGLLSQRRLGTWTELIVEESLKARMVLKNSPVGAALAQEGNDPKNLADYVGAGKVTWLRPDPAHMSTATLSGKNGQSIFAVLGDALAHVKLANHFVSKVIIQSADPNTPLDPALADALASVTYVNQTSAETIAAGEILPGNTPLRVLDLTKLNERIEWLQNTNQLGDYVVQIEYVDVNKKPHERKWANNIFFDGVGREAVGGSSMGAIASLFFGLNALNKIGQQNPLNMATKKGMGFRSWLRSPLSKAEELEANGASVTEVMAAKAMHLLERNPGGELMYADLPSLYKLVKLRHVVVGWTKGPDGKEVKTVWWPEQAIQLEEQGQPLPFDRWELKPLTMQQTQTLLGYSGSQGLKGTPGAMSRPVFNIQNLDIFPSLDNARLELLGLGQIGGTADIGQSRLAAVSLPPRAVATYTRGKSVESIFKRRIIEWRGELQKVADRRRESKLDIRKISTDNASLLVEMLDVETRAAAAHRLGVPEQGLVDLAAMEVSRQIAAQISRLMETGQNMVWVHRHGLGGDLEKGYVGAADVANNFAGMNGKGPVYGDVVIIDLSAVRATTDTHQEAAAEAGRILKEYAKRGVVVALQSSRGEYDLRKAVTEDLVDGSLGYRAMADSGNFFMPITEDADYNAAQRAIASTLLETQQFVTKNVALRLVTDSVSSSLTEAAEWIDHAHDRSYGAVSHLLLPYMTVSTGGLFSRNKFAYGIPQRGDGRADQASRVSAELLNLLGDPDGRAYLKKVLGGDNPDYRQYIEHENGQVEHGVLPIDKALDNLQNTLEAGKLPSDVGQTVFWGTIIPTVSGDGSIRLNRVGFKPPSRKDIKEQENELYGQNRLRITATGKKLDPNQTVPPPFVIDEHRSDIKGLSLVGTYHPGKMAKSISEQLGLKSGQAWMPEGYSFPDAVIGPQGAAGARVTRIMGSTSVVGKEARRGTVNNFRDGFAVTGIDFSDDMIDYFFGSGSSQSNERTHLWELTQKILREWEVYPHPYSTVDLSRILDNRSALVTMEARFNAIGSAIAGSRWQGIEMRPKNTPKLTPNQRLGTVILAALAAPGVRMEHVISTSGISTVADHDSGSLVRFMPALMTDALDDMDYPDLREMLIGRMNRNMPTYVDPVSGETRYYYWFDTRFKFHARMQQQMAGLPREEEIEGFLQIHIPIPADENSLRYTYSAIDSSGTESQHIANTVAAATGGKLLPKARSKKKAAQPSILDELYGQNTIERFEDEDRAPFELYHMLRRVTSGDLIEYNPWMRKTPMEEEHIRVARGKVRQYTYIGKRDEETGWTSTQKADADRLAVQFLKTLNINDPRAILEVEYLVRQLWGIPGPATDQDDYREHLTYDLFKAGVEYMQRNIDKGMHPLEGGTVPLEHESFWKMVFLAQQGLPDGTQWLPLKDGNTVKEYATADNWGEWVISLMGQMLASKESYDSRFGTDLDGFLHTYQGTHADYMDVALSLDEQVRAKLIHPDTNRPFMSVDPLRDEILREPVVLASNYMTYDALVGKGGIINIRDAEDASGSAVAKRRAAIEKWQRGEELPKQKDLSVREYARMGAAYQESSRSTSNAMRNLVNLSVTVRLFNPALWFSAMFEVPFRAALENATNILTGQSTGVIGRAQVAAAEQLGLTMFYSSEDLNTVNALNKSMGESNKFLGLVYGELAYQSAIGEGRGRIGKALEYSASTVAKMTADPRRGMGGSGLAKRYNDAVLEYFAMTNSQITVARYAWLMMRDPSWVEKEDPRAHRIGLNAVQQARGAKATMAGNLIMKPIDAMTTSENLLTNYAGHAFKIPFLFTRFNANMLLTLTGLNQFDQVLAMFFDGRQKPQVLKRLSNRAKYGEEHAGDPEYWDNTDVIESLDLSRAFVRGAVTHTALMAAGMMAGGLGLGGEDEEERRRKRLATYLNVPMYHNPLDAANDWRWHDAIFLDNVPVLNTLFKDGTGHSAVVPHWIFKQFLDPVLGMMRFFETGDLSEIHHGFAEAASVWPTSVKYLWQDATLTADLLAAQADEGGFTSEAVEQRRSLFTNIVFMYEKALVENAFINGLYTAKDRFDRNPYAIPGNENGDIIREQGTGQPAPTEALQTMPFNPVEGAPETTPASIYNRYAKRTGRDADLHAYTEKNATAALAMSIIPWLSGKDSTYLRENMVTQRQRVKVDETDPEQVEKLMYASFLGRGGQDFVTKEELIGLIKLREQNADRYWNQSDVEAEADAMYSAYKDAPLTIFDDLDKEQMTLDGKEAVFRSLRAGVIDLDNPAIAGFHVSWEERDEIAAKITQDLVQEGVDIGLSDQAAMYRMRRIWFGDATNPSVPGLREILYDTRIPSKPYVEYDQLNVTYTLGPDGLPWATPFSRTQILGVLGVPVPAQTAETIPGVTRLDERGNVVDLLHGINTGLAALQPRPIEPEEKREPNDDAVTKAESKTYAPGGGGYRRFGRRYGGGGGRGGYSSSSFGPRFERMPFLPTGTSPRIDGVPMINTSNPIIRRADVRRERIQSERGRLKQWQ